MDAKLKMKLGNKELEIVGKDCSETKMIEVFAFWSQLPEQCTECKGVNLALMHKQPKGNDYYGLKCNSCGAEFTFHQKKAGGFYTKQEDEFVLWGGTKNDVPKPSEEKPQEDQSDIPF